MGVPAASVRVKAIVAISFRVTPPVPLRPGDLVHRKQAGQPIRMLTAWDALSAAWVEEAGAEALLVGDSLAMVVLGHPTTLPVTLEQMLHHTRAVARG